MGSQCVQIQLPVSSGNSLVLNQAKMQELQKRYPLVDVESELKMMQETLKQHPELIKSRSGTPLMYQEWLKSVQKRRERSNTTVARYDIGERV